MLKIYTSFPVITRKLTDRIHRGITGEVWFGVGWGSINQWPKQTERKSGLCFPADPVISYATLTITTELSLFP